MGFFENLLGTKGKKKYSDEYKDLFLDIKIKTKIKYPTPDERAKYSDIIGDNIARFFVGDPAINVNQYFKDASGKYLDSVVVCAYRKDMARLRAFLRLNPEIQTAVMKTAPNNDNEDFFLLQTIKALLAADFHAAGVEIDFSECMLVNDMPNCNDLTLKFLKDRFSAGRKSNSEAA